MATLGKAESEAALLSLTVERQVLSSGPFNRTGSDETMGMGVKALDFLIQGNNASGVSTSGRV